MAPRTSSGRSQRNASAPHALAKATKSIGDRAQPYSGLPISFCSNFTSATPSDAPETLADPIEALEARAKPSGPRPHLLKQHFVYRTACRPMTRRSRRQTSRKSHLTNDLMVTVQLALI